MAASDFQAQLGRGVVLHVTLDSDVLDDPNIATRGKFVVILSDATPAQRANWTLIGNGHGVHWPDVDEDISEDGMLNGVPARRPGSARPAPKSMAHQKRARPRGGRPRR